MKLKYFVIFLSLSSSALAYNQQQITQFINQQQPKSQHHAQRAQVNTAAIKWTALRGPLTNGSFHIVKMKNNDSTLFAFHRYSFGEVYKSIDNGQHWKALPSPKNEEVLDLISVDEDRLLLAAGNHVYSSIDQGEHWKLNTTKDSSCDKLFALSPNLIMLITNHNYSYPGIYRSIDGGKTFTPAELGLDGGYPFWTIIGRDNILMTSSDGLFVSTNNGSLWTQASTNWEHRMLWGGAINSKHDIFVATGRLYRTDVNGRVWEKINDLDNVYTIKVDAKDTLYVINNKDLKRSTDNGKTWQLLHSFKGITDFTLLKNGKIIVSAYEGLMLSDETQLNYTELPKMPYSTSASVHAVALDEKNYFTIADKYSGQLYISHDAGKSWEISREGHVINDVVIFNQQVITLESTNTNSSQQVMVSKDAGQTWESVKQLTDNECTSLSSQNNSLIINCGKDKDSYFTQDLLHWTSLKTEANNSSLTSYFDGKSIYLSDGHFIKRSSDNGQTWTYLLNNLNHYSSRISGYKDEFIVIAINGAGVIKMTDGGKSWDLINDGLRDYHFSDLVVIDQNHYLVSTDDGISFTYDGGKYWTSANKGLTNYDVLSVSLYQNKLLAGTNGNGVFKAELS